MKKGIFTLLEILLRLCVSPRLRARLLRVMGARVGVNVRVYECRFINLNKRFSNLSLGNDVHIGTGCLVDLEGRVEIGRGTTISPGCVLMSHSDPGSSHGSPLATRFAPEAKGVVIGDDCWIGASSTLISGARIGDGVVVGAMSLVKGELPSGTLCVGVPVRVVRNITGE